MCNGRRWLFAHAQRSNKPGRLACAPVILACQQHSLDLCGSFLRAQMAAYAAAAPDAQQPLHSVPMAGDYGHAQQHPEHAPQPEYKVRGAKPGCSWTGESGLAGAG